MDEPKYETFVEFDDASSPDSDRLNRVSKFFTNLFNRDQRKDSSAAGDSEDVNYDATNREHSPDASMSGSTSGKLASTQQEKQRSTAHEYDPEQSEPRRTTRRLQDYNRSDFRQCWMPDARGKECYECQDKFSTFRRRHHCRICGQIFCARCCKKEVPGRLLGYGGVLRLCDYCYEVVLRFLKSSLSKNLNCPQKNPGAPPSFSEMTIAFLSRLTDSSGPASSHCFPDDKPSDDFVSDPRSRDFWRTPGVVPRLPFPGSSTKLSSNANLAEGTTATNHREGEFSNAASASASAALSSERPSDTYAGEDLEPEWLRGISAERIYDKKEYVDAPPPSSLSLPKAYSLSLSLDSVNLKVNTCSDENTLTPGPATPLNERAEPFWNSFTAPSTPPTVQRKAANPSCSSPISIARGISTDASNASLRSMFMRHADELLKYVFLREHLDVDVWTPILWPLAKEIAFTVKPEPMACKDDMNILRYVHVKALKTSKLPSAQVIFGTAFSKSVVHTNMTTVCRLPKILVLKGHVDYERVSGKLISIDPVIMQEEDYIRNLVRRIVGQKPDIVVVEKSVSFTALKYFREAGVTVVHNLKPSVLQRIARCTGAQSVESIEGQIAKPRMGVCGLFYCDGVRLLDGRIKNIMYFDECPPDLECTVLFRGPCRWQLFKVKRVFRFMLCALYSAKLEIASFGRYVCLKEDDNADTDSDDSFEPCEVCATNRALSIEATPFDTLGSVVLSNSPFLSFVKPYAEQLTTMLATRPSNGGGTETELPPDSDDLDSCRECQSGKYGTSDDSIGGDARKFFRFYEFGFKTLIEGINNESAQEELAYYRAYQGRMFTANVAIQVNQSADVLKRAAHLRELRKKTAKRVDRLHPFFHQRLALLHCSYSSKSENAPGFCLRPRVFIMDFYGRSDVTLGHYLERFCFNPLFNCPRENCCAKMNSHVRKLVHGRASIEISCQSIESFEASSSVGDEARSDQILQWDCCDKCKVASAASLLTKETWNMSFAKYLYYLFHGGRLRSAVVNDGTCCNHCGLHDQAHYFARNKHVACFCVRPIKVYGISLAPAECRIDVQKKPLASFRQKMAFVCDRNDEVFVEMFNTVSSLKAYNDGGFVRTYGQKLVTDLQTIADCGRTNLDEAKLEWQEKMDALKDGDEYIASSDDRFWWLTDTLDICRHKLCLCVQNWNNILVDFLTSSKKKNSENDNKAEDYVETNATFLPAATSEKSLVPLLIDEPGNAGRKNIADDWKVIQKWLNTFIMSLPFGISLHLCLPFGSVPVVVDELQVSSIIAFSLATREYANCLSIFPNDAASGEDPTEILKELGTVPGVPESTTNFTRFHVDLQFCDNVANFYCKVYFAKYFWVLRECVFTVDEERFIRSLSRCESWQPTGGKSGATFFRTLDGRFILKQMSRYEVQSFVKFAPAYFRHMSSTCYGTCATSLVKIFGVYRVGFKNTQSGAACKMDLAVMEYLFYGRNITEIYDLKGSLRNRWAPEKQQRQTDIVLLDENLLEKVCTDSFYLHPYSKLTLNVTINADTKLLSENHVMDYSLLVGTDEERSELVLGIIDYLRTYTWDKKIESWVKSVSVSGQPPTVISPELYRQRFVESMDVYFPMSPDQWSITFPIEV